MAVRIGGDDSVAWSVDHGNDWAVELNQEKGKLHEKHKDRPAINLRTAEGYNEGRDPVTTDGTYFKVTIQLPTGQQRQDFLDDLQRAIATAANGGTSFSFPLPIIARSYNQIVVEWKFTRGLTSV